MNIFFLFNNFHFALEIFGALAFFIAAWLAFDTYLLRRDFLTASQACGFLLLSVWQVMHAFGASDAAWSYAGFLLYLLGLLLVVLSLLFERRVSRPQLTAIVVLPPLAVTAFYVHAIAAFLYACIAFLAFRSYKAEFKATLKPLWVGCVFLCVAALFSVFYEQDGIGLPWVLGHLFEVVGFGALAVWVWQYLQLRVHEEMIVIFASSALFISIVVTLAFSIILVNQIEETTKVSLLTNAKVLDLAISRLKEEALAKTKFLSYATQLKDLLASRDFVALETEASQYLESEKLGFLIIVNNGGEVVLRAHALTQKEDSLSQDASVAAALAGKNFVTIESSPAEKFSIRASSPLIVKDEIVGVVVAGFSLDNVLADNIKRITGLEMSIWEGDSIAATTLLNSDGRTRGTGITLTDETVRSLVLGKGEETVVRTEILSRPALASYLPIKNADGNIIGMISSIKPQQEILALANATNRLTLISVVILMLILALPIYLITKRLSDDHVI